jgi:hypothetical protein
MNFKVGQLVKVKYNPNSLEGSGNYRSAYVFDLITDRTVDIKALPTTTTYTVVDKSYSGNFRLEPTGNQYKNSGCSYVEPDHLIPAHHPKLRRKTHDV